jgi:hypothetical protein
MVKDFLPEGIPGKKKHLLLIRMERYGNITHPAQSRKKRSHGNRQNSIDQ